MKISADTTALVALCVLVALAGCPGGPTTPTGDAAPTPTRTEGPVETASPTATPTLTPTATATPPATTTATPTPTPEPTPTPLPSSGDADGDDVTNGREEELGTDPRDPDTDGDGLRDGREATLGLDPTSEDTDGDTLHDDWELRNETDDGVAIPNASPARLDLYVTVYRAPTVRPLNERERADLRDAWGRMDVPNPDGTTGVDLHLRTRERDDLPLFDWDDIDRIANETEHAQAPWHTVLLLDSTGNRYGGNSYVGGSFSMHDGTLLTQRNDMTFRTGSMVHELLHNVVGTFEEGEYEGRTHTDEGWLKSDGLSSWELSDATAEHLAENGFD